MERKRSTRFEICDRRFETGAKDRRNSLARQQLQIDSPDWTLRTLKSQISSLKSAPRFC